MKNKLLLTTWLVVFGSGIYAQSTDTCRLKIGINPMNLYSSVREQPFVDLMKTCDRWQTDPNPNLFDSIPQDTNGYALQLPYMVNGTAQSVYTLLSLDQNFGTNGTYTYPAGTYTVLYDGKGKIRCDYDATVISESAGSMVLNVTPTNAGIILYIDSSDVNDHIRNIRVLMPGTSGTYMTQPFNQSFLDKLTPFSVLRFMEWGEINNHPDSLWSSRTKPTYYRQGSKRGCSYEYMIKLCNTTNKDMWINVPHKADSNYIANLATLIRDSLNPQLKIYLEYSNEVWNDSFDQYAWVGKNGPGSLDQAEKTAYYAARVFRIWSSVFGTQTSSRLVRVAVGQEDGPYTINTMMSYFINNNCNDSAYCKVDAISLGAYFGIEGFIYDTLEVKGVNATVQDVIRLCRMALDTIKIWFRAHNQTAIQYNTRLLFYEGGQHLVPAGPGHTNYLLYQQKIFDAQIDTGMYNIYSSLINYIKDSTKADLFLGYLAYKLQDSYGSWGSLESIYQDTSITPAPKYNAFIDYINSCFVTSTNELNKIPVFIKAYPNPFNNFTTLQFNSSVKNAELNIYNLYGQKLKSIDTIFGEKIKIERGNFNSGIYFYELKQDDKNIFTGKLILTD